jgi:NADPH-dependent ferric siderophore reductase
MLSVDFERLMFELKEGAIKHVGPSDRTATVKLYDVEGVEVREFGDKRVKLAFTDEDGNEVEVALFPEDARAVGRRLESLEAESDIFE